MQDGLVASTVEVAFVADNSQLVDDTRGLGYLDSKQNDPDGKRIANAGVLWGSIVHGIDEGDGWIRVGEKYLPTKIRGSAVLVRSPIHDVVRTGNMKMDLASIYDAVRAEDLKIDLTKINKKDPKQNYTYNSENIFTREALVSRKQVSREQTPRLSSKASLVLGGQTPMVTPRRSSKAFGSQTPMVTPRRLSKAGLNLREGHIEVTTITETCENGKYVDVSDASGMEIGDYISVGDEEFRIKSKGHCLVGLDKRMAKLHPVGTSVTIRASDPLGAAQKRQPNRLSLGSSSETANPPSRQLVPSGLGEGSKGKILNSASRRRSY